MLKQKAKIKWNIEGDENTKKFHASIKRNLNSSLIRGLMINGVWCDDSVAIKDNIVSYYKNLFEEPVLVRPKLTQGEWRSISREQKEMLERKFSVDEIKDAVGLCGGSKSLGPDGFNFHLYQSFWETLKVDLVAAVDRFWDRAEISKGCNASFIALIPKVKDPIVVKDFRPISLLGGFYKIVAKLLAERLKRVMNPLIDEVQNAFVSGRNILDGVLIANELVDYVKKKKQRCMIFKIDFEKAYDSLNWEYLLDVMKNMGFGQKWCDWIKSCLESASVSVLVNGVPSYEFSMKRGVRQGDPLSPFLFLLAAEGLNVMLKEARKKGLFEGVRVGKDGVEISHLQFADDTIFFGKWDGWSIGNLYGILKNFEKISGLKINFNKSYLYGVGVSRTEVERMANRIHCKIDDLSFIYLGLPVGASMRRVSDWTPVIEKFERKLASWKSKMLSFGGRLTLIKSVLNSLALY